MGAFWMKPGSRLLVQVLPLLCLVQPIPGISSDERIRRGSQRVGCCGSDLQTTGKTVVPSTRSSIDISATQERPTGLPSGAPNTQSISAPPCGPRQPCFHTQSQSEAVLDPALDVDTVIHCSPETGTQAPWNLGFCIHRAPKDNLCLRTESGDNSGIQMRIHNMSEEMATTTYHQYWKEGIYILRAVIYNEPHGAEAELGPYYVNISHEATSVFMNSSSVHADEIVVFGTSPDQKSTVVMHRIHTFSSYNVSFISQTKMANNQTWSSITVSFQLQSISVYTNGTVFATDTSITFVAVTSETAPLEFIWYFGDDPPVRTTSRSMKKRFSVPQRYSVTVRASNGLSSVISEPHHIRVQRRIIANRLVSTSSALVNVSVVFECRINFGTDVTFLWNFGDGVARLGNSSTSHIYSREGEFTVNVLAFNGVSAVSLRKQLFIVPQPCQPPPVKNMGPPKVQVWRSQSVELGVTFEGPVLCDISRGLSYSWSFQNSAGQLILFPTAVHTHRQTLTVPSYFLEPGNYTVLAKVQVEGSIVYSNYCVEVEVQARAPVSVISEGTHLFVSRTRDSTIILRGSQSYDPDNPGAILSFHWECTAANTPGHPCFTPSSSHNWDAQAPTLTLTTSSLSDGHDQFLFSLIVSSGSRNSSEAQVFLSTRSDPTLRWVHISWVNFKDIFVNWNEELSLRAECKDCGETADLSYSWDLFLVNATEKNDLEVPFCRTVGLLGSSHVGVISRSFDLKLTTVESDQPDPNVTTMASSWEPSSQSPSSHTPDQPAFSGLGRTLEEPTGSLSQLPASGDTSTQGMTSWDERFLVPSPFPSESLSYSAFSDFDAYYSDIQEAVPSRGRQPGTSLPGAEPSVSDAESPGDGDNLVDPALLPGQDQPALLVDWPKALLSRPAFHSYTSSGITGQALTVKPYTLSPGETYVLQASVALRHSFLGKAQLYLTVRQAPRGVSCHVQPPHGLEAHTIFSIFCMSGRPDFRYAFSYRIGDSSKHTLYRGSNTQYYFLLPAGEPSNSHKVLVSIEVTDGRGSQAQPCAVEVTVLPRFHGVSCPNEALFNSSLENLSTLQLMGSLMEMRNYVTMMARVLSRWAKEGGNTSCTQWSETQDAFISSVCRLTLTNQQEMIDSVLTLSSLIHFPNKLSFMNGVLILKYVQTLLTQNQCSGRFTMDKRLVRELILLVAGVLEVSDMEKPRSINYLRSEGTKIISNLSGCLCVYEQHGFHMSTRQMEFLVLYHNLQSSVQSLGSVQVHLPADLAGLRPAGIETQSPRYISQLMLFKKNLYGEDEVPGQIGPIVALFLFNCSSRRPISRQRLRKPVTVEFEVFGVEEVLDNRRNQSMFVLLRDNVNFHQFTGLAENPLESLQIRIEFSRPTARAFPVMLLVRFSEKPTPSDFIVKQIYLWDTHIVHIHIPATLQKDDSLGYLSLLDADYDRKPQNKYFAQAVNYTVCFQWTQCLFWSTKGWEPEHFSPQPGPSPEKVNCSYTHLSAFTFARRQLTASFEVSDIAKLQRHPENLLPSIFIVVIMILYALLATKSRLVDQREKKKMGHIFLQENGLEEHQLYAVVIDTGFRSPSHFTAKVYLILCGENGLSEPIELYSLEKPLFESNSRHTFILSTPTRLGPLQTVHLWHDSSGSSPAWYVSHVMVQELCTEQGLGQGQCWFFPAECWLASSRQDGRVDRKLACLHRAPGFQKLLYSTFTEYLEDFHVWASVYSRPSTSDFLHSQRLAVASTLLCLYSCLAALLTMVGQKQIPLGVSSPSVSLGAFHTGFLFTLLAFPGAQLLSLLFRLSEGPSGPSGAEPHLPLRRVKTDMVQGSNSPRRMPDTQKTCEKTPSAALFRTAGTQSRVIRTRASLLPPELDFCGGEPSQSPRKKSDQNAPSSHSGSGDVPQGNFEGLPTLQMKRAPLPWLGSATWFICGTVSMACSVGTGLLGYRFTPEQCVQWLRLLTSSVMCCVFLTQPLVIGLVALGFAWKRKEDKYFFTSSLRAATETLESELEGSSKTRWHQSASCSIPQGTFEVNKILAARQRAHRLHLHRAHLPSKALLQASRVKMQREMGAHTTLRIISMYLLMLLLFLFIVYGKFSRGEYLLNQAIRNEFTSGADISERFKLSQLERKQVTVVGIINNMQGLYGSTQWSKHITMYRGAKFKPLVPTCRGKTSGTMKQGCRSAGHPSGALSSMEEWWQWSLTTLLDGLYQGNTSATTSSPDTQPGALRGKCSLVGAVIIKQLRNPPESFCKLPSSLSASIQDYLSTCNLKAEDPGTPFAVDPEVLGVAHHDLGSFREDCELSLGNTRPAAQEVLTQLRAGRWIDSNTRTVSLHFALYNPPTQLFSTVSLTTEMLPMGGLTLSSVVESFTIFPSDSSLWYHLMLAELVLLVLSVTDCCLQLYSMIEKGAYNYWRKPRNWLEVSMTGVNLAFLAISSHLATLAEELTELFQKRCFRGFIDLSHMALWKQRSRWLQGTLSFLLMVKCLCLLGLQKTVKPPRSVKTCSSVSIIFTLGLMGILMFAAHHHLRQFLLFTTGALLTGNLADNFRELLFQFPGRSQRLSFLTLSSSDQQTTAWCYRTLSIMMAILCFGTLRGSLVTFARKRKSFQSKFLMRLKDVKTYMWKKAHACLELGGPVVEETEMAKDCTYYLDECSDLLDELLLKIDGLSDNLQLPLLEQRSKSASEIRVEDSSLLGVSVPGDSDSDSE